MVIKVISFIALILSLYGAYSENHEEVERIKVTGSHIKRIDQEGTSPVTVIDREQLDFSGSSSLADVIRNISFASFGVTNKYSLADGNGSSFTSFRGLPPGYVLILLNGKRFPSHDINMIPISAIERVEIVTDGASATYGSDAIGGVMNFITKKGDIGTTFSMGGSLPEPFVLPKKYLKWQGWRSEKWAETAKFKDNIFGFKGGEDLNASLTHGWAEDHYQVLLNVMYRRQQPVLMRNRPFGILSTDNGRLDFSRFGSPGTYIENGQPNTMEGCTTPITQGTVKGFCGFDFSQSSEFQPQVDTFGFFGETTMDVADDSEIYAHLFATYERSLGKLAPPPQGIKDFQDKTDWTTAVGHPNIEELYYRLVDEKGAGNRLSYASKYLFDSNVGLNSYLSDTWNLETSWNNNGFVMLENNKNYAKINELFKVQNGKALWNPFKSKDQKDDISFAAYEPWSKEYYLTSIIEAQLNGDLFTLGDVGTVYSAFGARLGYEYLKMDVDKTTWNKKTSTSNQWGGGVSLTGDGGRDWQTFYGELVLPLNLDILNSLELQISGSMDRYGVDYPNLKDWKSVLKGKFITANPKLALKWKPTEDMAIRGSWGTGFKAPDLLDIHLDQLLTHPSGVDTVRCQLEGQGEENHDTCHSTQQEMIFYGNKDLKPETANFYNIGFVVEPTKNVSASLDYFFYHINNRLASIDDPSSVTEIEYKAHTGNKEAQDMVQAMEIKTVPPAPRTGQPLHQIHVKKFNAGNYKTNGLDLKLMASFPNDNLGWTTYLTTQASYFFDIRIQNELEDKFTSVIGNWGFPVARLQMDLGVRSKNATRIALSARGTSRYNYNTQDEESPDTLLQSGVKWVKSIMNKKVPKSMKAVYKKEDAYDQNGNKKEDIVLQVPDHFEFDLTVSLPLSTLNPKWSSKSNILFKIENLLNSNPPESRFSQKNLAGVSNTGSGYQPNGFYYTNGRVWKMQYTHPF